MLSDGIYLGPTKMAEVHSGSTKSSLEDIQAWYISNKTYQLYGASMDVGYYVTPDAKVFTEVSYNHYSEGKGGSQMIDHSDNSYDEQGGDAAGIANKNYSISAGLAYRF